MRGLRHLFSKDAEDKLNSSPTFQWFLVALMVLVGTFLVFKGVNGVKYKRLTGKHGHEFKGTTAQVVGVIYVALGTLMVVIALVMKIVG